MIQRKILKKLFILFSIIFYFLLSLELKAQEDKPGSKDPSFISRYPGSYIKEYEQKEYDEYYLLLGPVKSTSDKDIKGAKTKKIAGKITKILYQCPKGRSNFEVFENYKIAIKKAGFEILYEDKGENVRAVQHFIWVMNREYTGGWIDSEVYGPFFFLSASSPRQGIFISLLVRGSYNGPIVNLAIVEIKEMEKGLINARQIEEELKAKGRIAIYGIYFDFDKADIKPESEPTIKEIAKFLKDNPEIKVYIVGHTDNIGKLEYNMDLSRRRAEAVVKELVEKYGIEKERLKAFGVGPLAPVASNDTEEGRAKNRRVEIVKQ